MAITSRGEIVILSLSLSSELSSFEVVSCTTPGSHARTPFETVSDGAFEPTSSTNSARVVLDASQLAYLKVTEREDNDDDELGMAEAVAETNAGCSYAGTFFSISFISLLVANLKSLVPSFIIAQSAE